MHPINIIGTVARANIVRPNERGKYAVSLAISEFEADRIRKLTEIVTRKKWSDCPPKNLRYPRVDTKVTPKSKYPIGLYTVVDDEVTLTPADRLQTGEKVAVAIAAYAYSTDQFSGVALACHGVCLLPKEKGAAA